MYSLQHRKTFVVAVFAKNTSFSSNGIILSLTQTLPNDLLACVAGITTKAEILQISASQALVLILSSDFYFVKHAISFFATNALLLVLRSLSFFLLQPAAGMP